MYRKGTSKDVKPVYDLMCDLERRELPFDRFCDIFQKQVSDKRYYCLVCELDNEIVGMLNLRFEGQLHHADYIAEILEFAIKSSYRKRGIGKEMFDCACNIAKEEGCIQIELATNQLRTDTHRFYLRENMHNFHYKFSKPLTDIEISGNEIGR